MEKMKLIIADDHPYISKGVENSLAEKNDIEVVANVLKLELLRDQIESFAPDIVLLDISFQNNKENGLDFLKANKDLLSQCKFIVFSQHDDVSVIKHAYLSGASSYLTKTAGTGELYHTINKVFEEGTYIPEQLAVPLANIFVKDNKENIEVESLLTEREYKVFLLTAKGKNRNEIADEANIALRTVANDLASCKAKLKIERPAEFTMLAMRKGFIS